MSYIRDGREFEGLGTDGLGAETGGVKLPKVIDPTTLASLPASTRKAVEAAMAAGSGLPTATVTQILGLYSSASISADDIQAIFGMSFSGETAVKDAWKDIADGIATGGTAGASLQKLGTAAYNTAIKKLNLPTDIANSDTLKGLLVGIQSPSTVAQRAAALGTTIAQKYAGKYGEIFKDGGKAAQLVYQHQYLEAWKQSETSVLTLLDKTGTAGSVLGALYSAGVSAKDIGADTQKLISDYQKSGDSAGLVAGGAEVAARVVRQVTNLVKKFGSAESGAVAEQVSQWTDVAAGCVTGIAAGVAGGTVGIVAGAVGCALSIFSKALETATSEKIRAGDEYPLAIFVPRKDQLAGIALDAQRLAMVLKSYYGINSWATIVERTQHNSWLHEGTVHSYPEGGSRQTKPAVGFTMYDVLRALTPKNAVETFDAPLETVALKTANLVHDESSNTVRKMRKEWYDVPAETVREAAWQALTRITQTLSQGSTTRDDSYNSKWTIRGPYNPHTDVRYVQYLAAEELLNFFAAVTLFERRFAPGALTPWFSYTAGKYKLKPLPVRLFHVGSANRGRLSCYEYDDKPECGRADGTTTNEWYSPECWTAQDRCYSTCVDLAPGVMTYGHICAIRELAFIRLLAAFSYLHMQHMWGESTSASLTLGYEAYNNKPDPLKEIKLSSSDPMAAYVSTVDPRTYYDTSTKLYTTPSPMTIANTLDSRRQFAEEIRKAVATQVVQDKLSHTTARIKWIFPAVLANATVLQNPKIAASLIKAGSAARDHEKKCKASTTTTTSGTKITGVPGVTKSDSFVCCPSLYYDENVKYCAEMRCYSDCTDKTAYTGTASLTSTLAAQKLPGVMSQISAVDKLMAKGVTLTSNRASGTSGFGISDVLLNQTVASRIALSQPITANKALMAKLGPITTRYKFRTIDEYLKTQSSKSLSAAATEKTVKTALTVGGVALGVLLVAKLLKG